MVAAAYNYNWVLLRNRALEKEADGTAQILTALYIEYDMYIPVGTGRQA